ncbi:MAG TPA: hypothetical protein VHE53_05540 [Patescibacteria group bacterium]|nr:hypothetical protein [Patescibacteria group bacterium]
MEPKLGRFAFWRRDKKAIPEATVPVPYPEITPESVRQELEAIKAHYTMDKHPLKDKDAALRVMMAMRLLETRIRNVDMIKNPNSKDNNYENFLPPIGRRIAEDVLKGLDSGHAAIRIREAKMKYLGIYQELGVDMDLRNMAYFAQYREPEPLPPVLDVFKD